MYVCSIRTYAPRPPNLRACAIALGRRDRLEDSTRRLGIALCSETHDGYVGNSFNAASSSRGLYDPRMRLTP